MDYDWDTFSTFKDELHEQLPNIETNIQMLYTAQTPKHLLNELFRHFHSFKATSDYLQLIPIHLLTIQTENVLNALRNFDHPIQTSIVDWLNEVYLLLDEYSHDLDNFKTDLKELPKHITEKVHFTSSNPQPKQKLKTLTLLYVDSNDERITKIKPFLGKLVAKCHTCSTYEEAIKSLSTTEYDILITNLHKENHELIEHVKQNHPYMPIVAIFKKIPALCRKRLLKNGISNSLESPLSAKALERELLNITLTYFSTKRLLIDNKKIQQFVQELKPLPNTIFQILQLCDEDETEIKELIKVVKTDPIIAGNILNAANSPVYGSVKLKSIDQAVTKFGKTGVKGLCLSGLQDALELEVDLEAYQITEEQFSRTANLRFNLMLKWFSKVSISDLSILSLSSMLSNLGQLLIAEETKSQGLEKEFQEMAKHFHITYVEESLLQTTTAHITSMILTQWGLDKELVDSIFYSDYPESAASELKHLACANYVVNQLISYDGSIATELSQDHIELLESYNIDYKPLKRALESLS